MFPIKDENPTEKTPVLTVMLISLNLGIFFYTYFSGSFMQIIQKYGMIPAETIAGIRLHTLFTSMFLHGGPIHVIGNVWYLWIFGDNIESYLGRWKFIVFFFAAGIAASLTHAFVNPTSSIPTIGASGAIAGVLGAYLIKYPRARVYTLLFFFLITIVRIPAIAFLGGWIVLQLISGSLEVAANVQGPTAYWAHIGGFVAGILLVLLLGKGKKSSSSRKMPIRRE